MPAPAPVVFSPEAEALIARFEAAWRAGGRPDPAVALNECPDCERPMVLVELVHADLEFRLKAGEMARSEDYLSRHAELAADPEAVADLVAAEVEWRIRLGEPNAAAELLRRFPTLSHGSASPLSAETLDPQAAGTFGSEPPSSEAAGCANDGLGMLGDYRLIRQIGFGGMGVVYEAADTQLPRRLAIKVMRPELAAWPVARARFLREARALAAVEHDNVAPILHVGDEAGAPYIVMPLLKGDTLDARLKRHGPLPTEEVLRVGRDIAAGLAAVHAAGLVHRDMKPTNVWLDAGGGRARVLDFGLARHGDGTDAITEATALQGTPPYMAPEQVDGLPVDHRADLFALGAILYECLTGRRAFLGATATAVMKAVSTHEPEPPNVVNPQASPRLSALVMALLAKNPGDRPPDAKTVGRMLLEIAVAADDEPTKTLTLIVPRPIERPRRRLRIAVGVVVAALFAVAAAAVAVRSLVGGPKANAIDPATSSPALAAKPIEPFRVKALEVKHYVNTPEGSVLRGVLGENSFLPLRGDVVQVVAKLSRPGYAYIIAIQPDGGPDLCFPNDEETPPPHTENPRYPPPDVDKGYGLSEGTGLWVFAVVASEKPLPTYREWVAGRKPNWKREAAPAGQVWRYDGSEVETLVEGSWSKRGKDEDLKGPTGTLRSLGRWLRQSPDVAIGVVGFGVGERK